MELPARDNFFKRHDDMDEKQIEKSEAPEPKGRREFVKVVAKAAVVAPAVALLLSAGAKQANAEVPYGRTPI